MPIGGRAAAEGLEDAGERGDVEREVGRPQPKISSGSPWRSSSTLVRGAAVDEPVQRARTALRTRPAARLVRRARSCANTQRQRDHDRRADRGQQREQQEAAVVGQHVPIDGQRPGEDDRDEAHRAGEQEQRGVAPGGEVGGDAERASARTRRTRARPRRPRAAGRSRPARPARARARAATASRGRRPTTARARSRASTAGEQSRGGDDPPRVGGREAVADLADPRQREDQRDGERQHDDEERRALGGAAEVDGVFVRRAGCLLCRRGWQGRQRAARGTLGRRAGRSPRARRARSGGRRRGSVTSSGTTPSAPSSPERGSSATPTPSAASITMTARSVVSAAIRGAKPACAHDGLEHVAQPARVGERDERLVAQLAERAPSRARPAGARGARPAPPARARRRAPRAPAAARCPGRAR